MMELVKRLIRVQWTWTHLDDARGHTLYSMNRTYYLRRGVTMSKTEETAYARVGMTRKYNLGGYESIEFQVAVEVPTPAAQIDEALTRATEIVEQRMIHLKHEAFGDDDGEDG